MDRCNKRATEVNQDLGQMKGVVIIEHPRFGSDRKSANRRFLSRDGLHLSTDGVRELKLDMYYHTELVVMSWDVVHSRRRSIDRSIDR